MNQLSFVIIVFFVILLVAVLFVAGLFAYLYFSTKSQFGSRLAIELARWRENELKPAIREQVELARSDASKQLAQWREQELELSRKQQFEVARGEAIVQLEQWKKEHEQAIRQDAVQRSQSVTVGKVTEHIVPYLPDFSYNPKDARFIGSPIDFVVFDGLNDGEVRKVVFIEVKTGSSSLSSRERRVRDAIQAGNVEWRELRPAVEAAADKTN